jgi:hypothetical protein
VNEGVICWLQTMRMRAAAVHSATSGVRGGAYAVPVRCAPRSPMQTASAVLISFHQCHSVPPTSHRRVAIGSDRKNFELR